MTSAAVAGVGRRGASRSQKLVVPGFNDAHVHFYDGGSHLASVQLRDAKTEAEFRERIRQFAAKRPRGRWILGGDWDHEKQPYHAVDDGRWAEKRIGPERAKTSYAFRSLLDAGAVLAFKSDWHVAPMEPLMGIYGAAIRRTLDGKHPGGWVPEQKISVEEAVRAYTWGSAYASFEEGVKGTIEVGKLADPAVLSQDIFAIDPSAIEKVRVVMTVFDGQVVYPGQ